MAASTPQKKRYKSTPQDKRRALTLGIAYIVLAIGLALMLFKVWPPTPWPSDQDLQNNAQIAKMLADCECPSPSPTPTAAPSPLPGRTSGTASQNATPATVVAAESPTVSPSATPTVNPVDNESGSLAESSTASRSESGAQPSAQANKLSSQAVLISIPIRIASWCFRTSFDERLILLVIIAGMLGSFVHGATSLADFVGNNNFNKNWTWFYLLRPVIGMALALVFYFVIRGGFLTTSGGAKDINPYGIAALAGLVGMFSKQATDKLSEVFGTLFRAAEGEGDEKRSGPLKPKDEPPVVTKVEPNSVTAGSTAQTITVSGSGFVVDSEVVLNGVPQNTTFESGDKLTAELDDVMIATAGTLKLKVVDPDGGESTEVDFTVS